MPQTLRRRFGILPLTIVCLGVAAGIGVLLLRGQRASEPIASDSPGAALPHAEGRDAGLAQPGERVADGPGDERRTQAVQVQRTTVSVWIGTAAVRTDSGGLLEGLDGEIGIAWPEGERTRRERAPVSGGVWELPRPNVREIRGVELELDGMQVRLPRGPVAVPDGDEVTELVGTWPSASRLRVVDAWTGADLQEVEVRGPALRAPRDPLGPPRELLEEPAAASGGSPIELPQLEHTVGWWVGARGYVWSCVSIDPWLGGEHLVPLSPAAEVRFHATDLPSEGRRPMVVALARALDRGAPPAPGAEGLETFAFLAVESDGRTAWTEIPAGRLSARLEEAIERSTRSTGVALSERIELEVAQHERREVELAHAPPGAGPDAGSIVFAILLPDGKLPEGAQLLLARADEPRPGEPRTWRFPAAEWSAVEGAGGRLHALRAGPFAPGAFVAHVRPWQQRAEFTLHGPGDQRVSIDVAQPRGIELVVLDAPEGDALPIRHATWELTGSLGALQGARSSSTESTAGGGILLRLPPAEVRVRVSLLGADGSRSMSRPIDGRTCPERVEWLYTAPAELVVELRDGLHVHPIPGELVPRLRLFRGGVQEEAVGWSFASRGPAGWGSEITLRVDGSGSYELRFPAIDGFLTPGPCAVRLSAGETTRVHVQLERRAP